MGTFLRTLVVLAFTFIMTLIVGAQADIKNISTLQWGFLVMSGLCTGLSWLCYNKAIQIGEVNRVVVVDKLSTVLTMVLAIIIFGESFCWLTFVAMAIMVVGTMLMINKKKQSSHTATMCKYAAQSKRIWISSNLWLVFALLSLVFASLTSILAKIGMQGINSQLGTFLRTIIVAIMAFCIVAGKKNISQIETLTKTNWVFIIISGILTGISWLCYYAALQIGIVNIVVPIDKLSVLVAVAFSAIFLKEKISKKAWVGMTLLICGTLLLLLP